MADEPNPQAASAASAPAAPAAATAPTANAPVQLPDDHPLVTAFTTQKAELAQFRKEKADAEEASKTEAQKQADTVAALQKENESLKAAALRAEVAAAKGVDADLLTGSTKAELEAAADKLIAWRGSPAPKLPGNKQPAGPVSQVTTTEETREDRRKRLAEQL